MCATVVISFDLPFLDLNSLFNYVWSMYNPSIVSFISMTLCLLLGFLFNSNIMASLPTADDYEASGCCVAPGEIFLSALRREQRA